MDTSQWEYIGEGGKHAIFAFHCPREENSEEEEKYHEKMFHGKLLRISKSDIRQSYKMMKQYDQKQLDSNDSNNDENSIASLFYIRNIIQPYFDQFVDVPQIIKLEWSFIYHLAKQTLQLSSEQSSITSSRRRIPASRKKDWIILDDDGVDIDVSSSFSTIKLPEAMLIMDYRTITSPSSPCINIEIKPKAGYLSISPLVDPLHRIKYTTTRFQLLQTLHENGYWSKGWTSSTNNNNNGKKSEYDPLDLFSNNDDEDHGSSQQR